MSCSLAARTTAPQDVPRERAGVGTTGTDVRPARRLRWPRPCRRRECSWGGGRGSSAPCRRIIALHRLRQKRMGPCWRTNAWVCSAHRVGRWVHDRSAGPSRRHRPRRLRPGSCARERIGYWLWMHHWSEGREVVAHDRALGRPPCDDCESCLLECVRGARKEVAGAPRHRGVDGISLHGGCSRMPGVLDSRVDQGCHDALVAKTPPHVKARQGPHGKVINRRKVPLSIQPGQFRTPRETTPADGRPVFVEGQQSRCGSCRRRAVQRLFVLLSWAPVVFRAQDPVHAPAAVGCSAGAE
jgi:hypothetical protein